MTSVSGPSQKPLEEISIHILREAYACFPYLCMPCSVGKDCTALLYQARKAFYGHVLFPGFISTPAPRFPR